jgi:hypothetical protein
LQRFWVEPVEAVAAFPPFLHQMSFAQQAQVFGNCGTGNGKGLSDSAGGLASLPQQSSTARRVGSARALNVASAEKYVTERFRIWEDCRALLGWTAGGGCPHVCNAAASTRGQQYPRHTGLASVADQVQEGLMHPGVVAELGMESCCHHSSLANGDWIAAFGRDYFHTWADAFYLGGADEDHLQR